MDSLSASQARRIALAAQGFAERRPGEHGARVDRRHFRRVLDTVGAVQIDTVNVVARAHFLTFFARLGPYDVDALGRWLHDSHDVWEYWGHAASFLPVDLHPALRWKMAEAYGGAAYDGLLRLLRDRPGYVDEVRAAVKDRGPLVPADLRDPGPRQRGSWWDWDPPKRALELLFWGGEVAAVRGRQFERVYDAPERVLPPSILAAPTPSPEEGRADLVRRAARAMGVFTATDLIDYFHQNRPKARPVVQRLIAEGEFRPVAVEGWDEPAYLHPGARLPRRVRARALLAPFDSLVWERNRAHRVFDFFYRIEIYVPAPKRIHGYYVLPFLLGDDLVGRVDLKADRQAGVLRVRAAWAEDGTDHDEAAAALAAELALLAPFLGLTDIAVEDRGTLAPSLALALG
jgi:uncharacterized protein YcaQ